MNLWEIIILCLLAAHLLICIAVLIIVIRKDPSIDYGSATWNETNIYRAIGLHELCECGHSLKDHDATNGHFGGQCCGRSIEHCDNPCDCNEFKLGK